jgi:hypothetical protein
MFLKQIVCTLIIFFTATTIQAQFFKASVLAATNFAQVDGDHIGGYNKVGLNAGIGIHHEIDNTKSVGFEMLYSQRGSKLVNDPDAASQPIYIIKSSYIDFPLVYSVKIPAVNQLSFHTGLSIDINISGTIDDGARVSEADFNSVELGFILGSTYHVSEKVGFRVRHSYSLNKISANIPVNSQRILNRTGMYNRWFSLGLVFQL